MPSYTSNSAMRSGLEAQVNFMNELTRRSFDSVRQLSEMNMNFVHQVMQTSVEASRKMMNCSDPFQMAAAGAAVAEPAAQHLRAYQQQLASLFTGGQLDFINKAEQGLEQAARSGYGAAQEMARNLVQAADSVASAGRPEDRTATESYGGNGHAAPH